MDRDIQKDRDLTSSRDRPQAPPDFGDIDEDPDSKHDAERVSDEDRVMMHAPKKASPSKDDLEPVLRNPLEQSDQMHVSKSSDKDSALARALPYGRSESGGLSESLMPSHDDTDHSSNVGHQVDIPSNADAEQIHHDEAGGTPDRERETETEDVETGSSYREQDDRTSDVSQQYIDENLGEGCADDAPTIVRIIPPHRGAHEPVGGEGKDSPSTKQQPKLRIAPARPQDRQELKSLPKVSQTSADIEDPCDASEAFAANTTASSWSALFMEDAVSSSSQSTEATTDIQPGAFRVAGIEPSVDDGYSVSGQANESSAAPRLVSAELVVNTPPPRAEVVDDRPNNRGKYMVISLSCVVVMVLIGIIVGLLVGGGGDGPPDDADGPPDDADYLAFLAENAGSNVYPVGTSQYVAADWIINEDPLDLGLDAPNLVQRYILTLLYYTTTNNLESKWRTCNPPEADESIDCTFQVVQDFDSERNELVYRDEDGIRWLSGREECDWAGVACDEDGSVQELSITGHNLIGSLPSELAALSKLQLLSIAHNNFTGNAPWLSLGRLHDLYSLKMHHNEFDGSIPVDFWANATALRELDVGANHLRGTVGDSFQGLTDLQDFRMFQNRLSGSIPSGIGDLSRLTTLDLSNNDFEGLIPSELGLFPSLEVLNLTSCDLTGSIPEEIYNIASLKELRLSAQRLNGTLSTRVEQLANLTHLWLDKNQLIGTIPSELANLRALESLQLYSNNFSSSVPPELCRNINLGQRLEIEADCAPPGDPPNDCFCCSRCCNRAIPEPVCLAQER